MKALRKGQCIKHFEYCLGVITESNEQRTSIDFDIHGMKRNNKPVATPFPAAPAGAK
jgi:hypothetical protein